MKKVYLFAAAALALASCSDDFTGGTIQGPYDNSSNVISLGAIAPNNTRAGEVAGSAAANKLGGQFTVYGYKSAADHSETEASFDASNLTKVFPYYTVNYVENSAYTTESNSHSWEYVGYQSNPIDASEIVNQTIKYWDYAANHYDFMAWAIKDKNAANLTELNTDKNVGSQKYNLVFNTPDAAALGNVYVANRVTMVGTRDKNLTPSDEPNYTTGTTGRDDANKYGNYVLFNFRNMAAKVRIGLYETIPGYSVSDVKFYKDETNKTDADVIAGATETTATLYNASTDFATGGTVNVYYRDYNAGNPADVNSNVAVAATSASESKSAITFGVLAGFQDAEYKEATGNYIGRNSTEATLSEGYIDGETYSYVFPKDAGTLKLKVDYTLTSIDGSGETLKVVGANATVPAGFGNWISNYAYTYLFKISDNTNGEIGGHVGLYPITFDALVVDMVDANTQETITEIARTSSITTYQKGSTVTEKDEYHATTPISVVVDNGVVLAKNTSIQLYEVKNLGTEKTTEEVIANYSRNKVVLTDITESEVTIKNVYAGADGNDKTVGTNMVAEFVPVAGYNYAVKYTNAGAETWKYIKIADTGSHTESYVISDALTVNVGGTAVFTMTGTYNGAGGKTVLGAAGALVSTNTKLYFTESNGTITVNAPADALAADATSGTATVTLNSVAPSNNTITIQGWTLSDVTVACASTSNTVTLQLNGANHSGSLTVGDFKTDNDGITVTDATDATVTFDVAATVPAGTYHIYYNNAVANITVQTYSFTKDAYYINRIGKKTNVGLKLGSAAANGITIVNSDASVAAATTATDASGLVQFTSKKKGVINLSYANAKATLEVTNFNVKVMTAIKADKSDIEGDEKANGVTSLTASGKLYVKLMDGTTPIASPLGVTGGGTVKNAGGTGLWELTLPASGTVTLTYTYKGQTFSLWSGSI